LAEIEEIDRFDHAKKLVAFAGVDPSVFSSGKFTATINKITIPGGFVLPYIKLYDVVFVVIEIKN
jgi:hypothetical protein